MANSHNPTRAFFDMTPPPQSDLIHDAHKRLSSEHEFENWEQAGGTGVRIGTANIPIDPGVWRALSLIGASQPFSSRNSMLSVFLIFYEKVLKRKNRFRESLDQSGLCSIMPGLEFLVFHQDPRETSFAPPL